MIFLVMYAIFATAAQTQKGIDVPSYTGMIKD